MYNLKGHKQTSATEFISCYDKMQRTFHVALWFFSKEILSKLRFRKT